MKESLFLFAAIVLLSYGLLAQQPVSTPPREEGQVVRIATDLIQVDVPVTDGKGKVVTGLSAADFEIFENGEKQVISNFEFRGRLAGGVTLANANKQKVETGRPEAVSATAAPPSRASVRRSIAVVIDDLNLAFGSIYYAKRALHKFVDAQMEPDDLVAIVRTGGGAGSLQQFTNDKRLLHATINKIRWNPFGGSFDSLASVGQNDTDISDRFNRESELVAGGAVKKQTRSH